MITIMVLTLYKSELIKIDFENSPFAKDEIEAKGIRIT